MLAMGKNLTIYTPHNVAELLSSKESLAKGQLPPQVSSSAIRGVCSPIKNLSLPKPSPTFLSEEAGELEYDCKQIVVQTYSAI